MKYLLSIMIVLLCSTSYGAMQISNTALGNLGVAHRLDCSALDCSVSKGELVFGLVFQPALTIGDGDAEDSQLNFDGNAQDFYLGLDDGTDDLLIGVGSAVGTTPALSIDENTDVSFAGNISMTGAMGLGAAATFTDSDATPDVSDGSNFESNTTTLTITDFDGAGIYEGQLLVVVSKGAITYDVTSSGIVGGSTNIITASGDVTSFMYDGADWLVLSRIDLSDDLN